MFGWNFKGFWLFGSRMSGWNFKGLLSSFRMSGWNFEGFRLPRRYFEGFQPSGRSRTPKCGAPIWPNLQEIGSDLANPIESQLRFGQSYR
uniref:Uncharacterized protein n=1 Tax=Rhizophagus irregularis (strain DAOM 181602 / DAOM 197198 / MUCL 43194) TaxID=747089 RepID=U9UUK0_RHIID